MKPERYFYDNWRPITKIKVIDKGEKAEFLIVQIAQIALIAKDCQRLPMIVKDCQ
jgi:hypothetical protein